MSVQEVPAAFRRAGSRRRYNATRQVRAALRRVRVAELLDQTGHIRGSQRRIAQALGVSEATISRDVAALLRTHVACPTCRAVYRPAEWRDRTGQEPPRQPGVYLGQDRGEPQRAASHTAISDRALLDGDRRLAALDELSAGFEGWHDDAGDGDLAWDDDVPPVSAAAPGSYQLAGDPLSADAFRM